MKSEIDNLEGVIKKAVLEAISKMTMQEVAALLMDGYNEIRKEGDPETYMSPLDLPKNSPIYVSAAGDRWYRNEFGDLYFAPLHGDNYSNWKDESRIPDCLPITRLRGTSRN